MLYLVWLSATALAVRRANLPAAARVLLLHLLLLLLHLLPLLVLISLLLFLTLLPLPSTKQGCFNSRYCCLTCLEQYLSSNC